MTETYCSSCTQGELLKFNFTWTIKNFSFEADEERRDLQSSIFTVGSGNDETKWNLDFDLKSPTEDNKGFFGLYLNLNSCKKPELQVSAKYKLAILNSKKKETCVKSSSKTHKFKPHEAFGFPHFIEGDFLHNPQFDFLPNDTLTILCEGSILMNSTNISKEYISRNLEYKLTEDLRNLLESGRFSDVTFLVSNQEIKAHKIILAARSEVFAAMFSHEMEEQRTNRVVISDIDHDVFKEMLFLIYTEESPNLDKMANDLLVAADKYQLEKLKTICEHAIVPKLSVDKAVEILLLADRHSADQLKKRAIEFITQNTPEVMQTEDWNKLTTAHIHLIMENLCKITHK